MGDSNKEVLNKEHFFPSGALAFFMVLILTFALIWFGVYFMMIKQA